MKKNIFLIALLIKSVCSAKIKFRIFIFSSLPILIILLSVFHNAYAASLILQSSNKIIVQNAPFTVDVLLDPQGQIVNAAQGEIDFSAGELSLQGIYTGGSIINLWITHPAQSKDGVVIWSGIIPGGFEGILRPDQENPSAGKIFTLVFNPLQSGTAEINFKNAIVLLNDGKGTQAPLTTANFQISINPATQEVASSSQASSTVDHNPPDPFNIILSRNPNIFNNKWFIVFNAQDQEAGIASYGVLESFYQRQSISDSDWQIAESPYLLRDQSLSNYVYVRAVDYNGNVRVETLMPTHPISRFWRSVFYLLAALIVIVFAIWIIKTKK